VAGVGVKGQQAWAELLCPSQLKGFRLSWWLCQHHQLKDSTIVLS